MGHSTHVLRALAMVVIAVFVAAGCRKSNNNNSNAPQTEPPTATPGVQSAGDFGLVGGVDHAFEGVGPPVQVALAGVSVTPSPDASGPSGTSGAGNSARATQQGVMRITLDNVSGPLHDKCGVSAGDKVNVFWLTDTQFDTALLNASSLESSLEGHKIGVAGSIFVTGSSDQSNVNLGLPTPSTSPSASVGSLNTNCTLVADSVSSTATEVLPTVRPRTRATAKPKPKPKPTATATATPKPKPTPTPTPKHTATPKPPTGPTGPT